MRKSGGGLQARPAWRPSQLRKSNPADSGMWKPIKGRRLSPRPPVVHADSRAPLPAPKHSPAPVTRTQTHAHARHTPSGPCSLTPSPFSKNCKFHSSEGSWFSWQCRALGSPAQGGDPKES